MRSRPLLLVVHPGGPRGELLPSLSGKVSFPLSSTWKLFFRFNLNFICGESLLLLLCPFRPSCLILAFRNAPALVSFLPLTSLFTSFTPKGQPLNVTQRLPLCAPEPTADTALSTIFLAPGPRVSLGIVLRAAEQEATTSSSELACSVKAVFRPSPLVICHSDKFLIILHFHPFFF